MYLDFTSSYTEKFVIGAEHKYVENAYRAPDDECITEGLVRMVRLANQTNQPKYNYLKMKFYY